MLRFIIALFMGKLAKLALKILGRRATHFPGKLAVRICPDFLKYVAKPKRIICVTGTNGKTSTCNMIEDCLRLSGESVLDNSFGSNTLNGIAATLLSGVSVFNKPKFKTLVLEVDERSSLHIYKHITPTYFVCTNLFRDSLMRNAHTEFIFKMIDDYLPAASTLVLNGDDVISSRLGKGRNENRVFFSVNKLPNEQTEDYNIINDAKTCPECGEKMIFDFKRYHHIGRAHCSKCSMESPKADYVVTDADEGSMTVAFGSGEHKFPLVNSAIFNVYNQCAVIAVLDLCGIAPEKTAEYLKNIGITATRFSEETYGKLKVTATMLKGFNPIACSRNIHTARITPGKKSIMLMVDDTNHEREDCEIICWHYEADFEALCHESIDKIYISGPRALDIRYRLLLAGIKSENIITGRTEKEVVEKMELQNIDKLLIFYDMLRYDILEKDVKPAIAEKIKREAK